MNQGRLRLSRVVLAMVLISALGAVGCAPGVTPQEAKPAAKAEAQKPAAAPAKAEAQKPAAAPAKAEAQKPAAAPAKAEAGEKPRSPVYLRALTASFGGASYIMGFALADILNKNSSWVRASAIESFGSEDNVKTGEKNKANKENSLMYVKDLTYWNALAGNKPYFEKKYPDLRTVFMSDVITELFITLRDDIKTPQDWVGKKVVVGAGAHEDILRVVLGDMWGIIDKVQLVRIGDQGDAARALADGKVDVSFAIASNVGPGKWVAGSNFQELMLSRKPHVLGITKSDIEKARQKTGWPISGNEIPAGQLFPNQPAFVGFALKNVVVAYADMAADIVYEVTKTVAENTGKFGSYHATGKGLTLETMTSLPVSGEAEIHPGALKYYKEKGMKVGQ